jgi:hypothetical protein
MTTQSTPTTRRLALLIAGVNLALLLVNINLRFWFSPTPGWSRGLFLNSGAVVVYSLVGVLILSRYPRHMIGWLFLIIGFLLGLVTLLSVLQALEPRTDFGAAASFFWWVCHIAFVPAYIIPLSFMLLYFPDGQLPSQRWWPVAVAGFLGIIGSSLCIAFYPWPWEQIGIPDANNPFAIPGSEELLWLLLQTFGILIAIGVFGSLIAVVVRFRRSRGAERAQMKWLVYTAVGGMATAVLLSSVLGPLAGYVVLLTLPTLLAIAIGIAILRYRLWNIDIIINRTMVYGSLTATLALLYYGLVTVLQNLVVSLTGEGSSVVIVISTLAIAALFNPLRRRIQEVIDRRFYRRKYDAAKELSAFSSAVRDEVELERLAEDLLSVVERTMQPENVSIWLRK